MTTKTTVTDIVNVDEGIQEIKPHVRKRRGKPDVIYANFNRRSKHMWVDFNLLRVDIPAYQRNTRMQKVIKMAHRWNPDKVGTIVVNKRDDGFYYIIDGQHRYLALDLIANHPPKVYCEVFFGLTVEEEAQMFHDLDSERDNLTPGASFKALLAANDSNALAIARAATNAGMTVDYDRGPVVGNVRAFKTLLEIYRRQGEDMLTRILRVCNLSWPTSNHAAPEPIMRGLEILFAAYDKNISDKRLIEVLSRTDNQVIINQARLINGTLSSVIYPSIAVVIRNMYNKKMGDARRLDTTVGLGL